MLFKLDLDTSFGVEINIDNLKKCKEYDFTLFNPDKFLYFCILSGCDYFKLEGIGNKKAYQIVKERNSYTDVLRYLKFNNKAAMCIDKFEESFEKAFLTFKFQVVYCPLEKKLRYINDIKDTVYTFINKFEDKSFLGR